MKTRTVVIVMMLIIGAVYLNAQGISLPANADKELIEDNLLAGLRSDNAGLKSSCAFMLGKMKSTRAVIPLMALLRKCDDLHIKTSAAWALCNIGDPRGTFAVKREVQFSSCCKTKLRCAWYYENLVQNGTFTFNKIGEDIIAELK